MHFISIYVFHNYSLKMNGNVHTVFKGKLIWIFKHLRHYFQGRFTMFSADLGYLLQ